MNLQIPHTGQPDMLWDADKLFGGDGAGGFMDDDDNDNEKYANVY